jgi:cellulose synthase/poly-beta-1,6-N-acetylglucosamine synthase-like glycosyltransferase
MSIAQILTLFILTSSVANLIRMMLYLVGSDIYAIKRARSDKQESKKRKYEPTVTLAVPAHNESSVIVHTLDCLMNLDYPAHKLQIIIADDGSTDDTLKVVRRYKRKFDTDNRLQIFHQVNGGKADVLNNSIRALATGKLVMCLDADSLIAQDAVKKSVAYFRDRRIVAIASNVNILENGTILGLAQRFEYLISYHMKKAQTQYNIEYIIGGIGSMFRHSMLKKINLYDTNTMTEDIDLTMKIIAGGNKTTRVAYAHDSITYTEAVPSFKSLVTQRFRWKYGRMQTFLKNYRLFFSLSKKHTRLLTWFILPTAVLQELLFVIEPIIVSFIIGVSIYYHSPQTVLTALSVISFYIIVSIWSTAHLTTKEKLRLSFFAPSMYVLLYLLSVVEYLALLRAIVALPNLKKSISGHKTTTWVSPERSGSAQKVVS